MIIKQLHKFFSIILLVTFSLIATPVDQNSKQDLHFIQTEFIQKQQIAQDEFIKAIAFLSAQETEKTNFQQTDPQDQKLITPKFHNQPANNQSTTEIQFESSTIQDLFQFGHTTNVAFRKALLNKVIQTKRNLNTQAHRIKQYILNPQTPLQTAPVIITTDIAFALAAGAVIVEKIVVAGATIATGAFVGSNNDPKNSPIPATSPAQATTANDNVQPAPKKNSQIATPCGSTKISKPQKITPRPKAKDSCSPTTQPIATTPCSHSIKKSKTHTFYNPGAFDANRTEIDSDAQKAHASHTYNMTANQDSGIKTVGKFGAASLSTAGLTITGPAGAVVAGGVIVSYGIAKAVKKRKEFHKNHPEYKTIQHLVKEEQQKRKNILYEEKKELKRILQEAQLSFKEIKQLEKHKVQFLAKSKKKVIPNRKPRQNDANRIDTPNSGNGLDTIPSETKTKTRKYTGNKKHHPNALGKNSKSPINGQKALNESKLVKIKGNQGLETRVGIENNKIVKFQEHAPGEYHGYIVEEKLDQDTRNTLIKAGLMKPDGTLKKR